MSQQKMLKDVEIGEKFLFESSSGNDSALYIMGDGYHPVNMNTGRIFYRDARFAQVSDDYVTPVDDHKLVSESYLKELEDDARFLSALHIEGVNMWRGYSNALQRCNDDEVMEQMGR